MRKLIALLLVLSMALCLISCSNSSSAVVTEDTNGTAASAPNESEETQAADDVDWTTVNPLTGEPSEKDYTNTRPIAVMLNNVKDALPQSGNSQADILYEVPEEGGATRIMGVYQDLSDVGVLGSIRSTRPYYVRLAMSNDAVLVHAGGSGAAYRLIKEYMESCAFDDMDFLEKGTNSAYNSFYRDSGRFAAGYKSEHTLFITSDSIMDYLTSHPDTIKLDHRRYFRRTHHFVEDATPVNGFDAGSINVSFSGYKGTAFDYDEESGTYKVSEFDMPYMDEAANTQVSVENVIVIQTDIEPLNDAKGHVAVYLTGTGSGYFACNGKMQRITWSKERARYTYTFYDEEGNEVDLGVGKSFVCVVDKGRPITVNGENLSSDYQGEVRDLANGEALSDEDAE